ncbi:hypothetical protein ACIVBQ_001456 [Tenacibaculum discolor]
MKNYKRHFEGATTEKSQDSAELKSYNGLLGIFNNASN